MKKTIFINITVIVLGLLLLPQLVSGVAYASDYLLLYEDGKRIKDNSVAVIRGDVYDVCNNGLHIAHQGNKIHFYKTKDSNLMNWDTWENDYLLSRKECAGYVTLAEELKQAKIQFKEDEAVYYQEIKERVLVAASREEREAIWDEFSEKQEEYLHDKGFTFYGNPDCERHRSMHDDYLQEKIDQALYYSLITLPAPTSTKETGGREGMIGGVIGEDRYLKVDLITKQVEIIIDKTEIKNAKAEFEALRWEWEMKNYTNSAVAEQSNWFADYLWVWISLSVLLVSGVGYLIRKAASKNIQK